MLSRDWWLVRRPSWWRRPDWFEIPEWWSRPSWLGTPSWMREPPDVVVLLLAGIVLLVVSLLYAALPPASLPSMLPGSVHVEGPMETILITAPAAAGEERDPEKKIAYPKELLEKTQEEREKFWRYVQAAKEFREERARAGIPEPAKPEPAPIPTRRWSHSVIAALLAGGALALSWRLSGTRLVRLGLT